MKSSLLKIFIQFFLLTLGTSTDLSGLRCEGDGDCVSISGSICNTNLKLCECSGNQVLNATMQKCLPVASGAGDACEESVQCSAVLLNGGTCKSGKCGCTDGMHYLRGRCWPSKSLGGVCSFDEECVSILEVSAVKCVESKCQCADGFYQREYSDCRKRVENVGEPCVLDSDCTFEDGFCNASKVCESISGFVNLKSKQPRELRNNTVKTPKAEPFYTNQENRELGAACSSNPDCTTANSECAPSGYCICKSGFFKSSTGDKCSPEIGGPCSQNEECTISGSSCDGTMCVCGMGTAASATKQECLTQIYDYNRRCNETSQCTLFGSRVSCKAKGTTTNCVCDDFSRHLVDDHICWISKGPGDECADTRDCSAVAGDSYINCVENKCTCIDGYHASSDGTNCLLDAPELGDVCTEDNDCEVEFAICDKTTKKCTCKAGYYKNGNGACIVGVGGPCSVPEDCASAADSVCTANKCQCPAGWTSNLAISACLPISSGLNSTCVENQQCTPSLGEFSECSEEHCQCRKKHHLVESTCTPSKGLGDDCTRSYECYLPVSTEGVICRNNKCSCDYGLVPAENNAYCTSSAARASLGLFTLANAVLLLLVSLK